MHRIPKDLDLDAALGAFTTQIRVGQFDLQFTFGPVSFAVQSPVNVFRDGQSVAHWEGGHWPDPGFYEVMNSELRRYEVVSERLLVLELDNGLALHLEDNSDQYESMQITFEDDSALVVV